VQEVSESDQSPPPETKGHEPPAERLQEGHQPPTVEPAREYGHPAPGTRGHQPPADHIELGHPPAEGVVIVQSVGEMHSPAVEAPLPTAAPPKPADAAQSVTPPQAHESAAPSSGDSDHPN
jgi:hypothetical protein